MALTNLAVAEEALGLSQTDRAALAKLLIESLEDDPRSDEEIKADLTRRLHALTTGSEPGLSFKEVFNTPQ